MTAPTALETLHWAQTTLEEFYGAPTGLDVRDFVRTLPNFDELGRLHVEQDPRGDIDLALLLDRDIFSAWESQRHHRATSVICEEVSHFVYLGFNHRRQRNVCALELELQSEVDRILLAFHPKAPEKILVHKQALLSELHDSHHASEKSDYERARKWAAQLMRQLSGGDPRAWGAEEMKVLRDFFHRDLGEKIHLLRKF
ncbi:MAG: hypothetical protein ABIR96_12925 [Bdellovibrionota bacterium]